MLHVAASNGQKMLLVAALVMTRIVAALKAAAITLNMNEKSMDGSCEAIGSMFTEMGADIGLVGYQESSGTKSLLGCFDENTNNEWVLHTKTERGLKRRPSHGYSGVATLFRRSVITRIVAVVDEAFVLSKSNPEKNVVIHRISLAQGDINFQLCFTSGHYSAGDAGMKRLKMFLAAYNRLVQKSQEPECSGLIVTGDGNWRGGPQVFNLGEIGDFQARDEMNGTDPWFPFYVSYNKGSRFGAPMSTLKAINTALATIPLEGGSYDEVLKHIGLHSVDLPPYPTYSILPNLKENCAHVLTQCIDLKCPGGIAWSKKGYPYKLLLSEFGQCYHGGKKMRFLVYRADRPPSVTDQFLYSGRVRPLSTDAPALHLRLQKWSTDHFANAQLFEVGFDVEYSSIPDYAPITIEERKTETTIQAVRIRIGKKSGLRIKEHGFKLNSDDLVTLSTRTIGGSEGNIDGMVASASSGGRMRRLIERVRNPFRRERRNSVEEGTAQFRGDDDDDFDPDSEPKHESARPLRGEFDEESSMGSGSDLSERGGAEEEQYEADPVYVLGDLNAEDGDTGAEGEPAHAGTVPLSRDDDDVFDERHSMGTGSRLGGTEGEQQQREEETASGIAHSDPAVPRPRAGALTRGGAVRGKKRAPLQSDGSQHSRVSYV